MADKLPPTPSCTVGPFFPTHYFGAWETMFTQNTYSPEMLVGIIVQLAYLVVVGTVALVWFDRKDIRS